MSNAADARARGPRATARRVWQLPARPKRMSTYITALVAGEYHAVRDTYAGQARRRSRSGIYCRQSLVRAPRRRRALRRSPSRASSSSRRRSTIPYPFGKYDQLFVPEYNMGAMENAGCVTFRDEYLFRSRQDARVYECRAAVILHEMAHMWFGDLVTMKWWDDLWLNESFAEWACYHAAVETHRVHRGVDRLRQRPQELGLPPGPAAVDAPDRRRHLRPGGGRGQLRRHHLRQGRLGAQAAGRVGRARGLPRRAAAVLQGPRVRQHRVRRPADGAGEDLRPRARRRGRRSGCRPPASTRWPPSSSWPTTAPTRRSRSARPRRPTTRRCAGTGSASASTTRSTAGWSVVRTSRSTSRATCTEVAGAGRREAARPAAAQRRRPDLRQDPARRALAATRWSSSLAASTTRWPARCAGARPGT